MKQIAFPYLPNTKSLQFLCNAQRHISFSDFDKARTLQFPIDEQPVVRELKFAVGRDNTPLSFLLYQRQMSDAILGVLDPYLLGELDEYTIDFKMWNDERKLVPNYLPGAKDSSIFDFTGAVRGDFDYRGPIMMGMDLGERWMGGYGHIPEPLYLYLRNTWEDHLPYPNSTIDISGQTQMYNYLKTAELLSYLTLHCKSILSRPWTLGEIDPYELGYFDPQPMWLFTRQTATAMFVKAYPSALVNNTSIEGNGPGFMIRNEDTPQLESTIEIKTGGISKGLIGMRTRREALLGDMDDKPLSKFDRRCLNIHYYGKIPAIVTVDTET